MEDVVDGACLNHSSPFALMLDFMKHELILICQNFIGRIY